MSAALLLEQAAHVHLLRSPPHEREYGFNAVLAGLRYNSAGNARLGLRCYRCALYENAQWASTPCAHCVMAWLLQPRVPYTSIWSGDCGGTDAAIGCGRASWLPAIVQACAQWLMMA